MSATKRILFVDDEPSVLSGLRRMLHRMKSEWDMIFVESGDEALRVMSADPVDVIVSDMRMPGMNGAQLLEKVQELHPHTVRLILSGYSDQELVLRSVGPAHQFLAKPCSAEVLLDSIQRSCSLRQLLDNQLLTEKVGRVKSLPALPDVYTELLRTLANEESTLFDVGNIIGKDIGMSAKILQLVNSSFFGIRQNIDSPARAVMYLGLDTVKSLVLTVSVFSSFSESLLAEFSIKDLQQHSLLTGALAKSLAAELEFDVPVQEDTFCAGILHDVGKLLLISNFATEMNRVIVESQSSGRPISEIENEIIGTNHAQLGGYLLALWGLPDPIVEAVTLHEQPSLSPSRSLGPLALVHLANGLEHEFSGGSEGTEYQFDMDYLDQAGINDLPRMRELASAFVEANIVEGVEG